MENKKRSKIPSFKEGHKRETRKSYQAYIEEIQSSKTNERETEDYMNMDENDDSSVRRSKRTPVPKRGFKLIDTYDTKKNKSKDTKQSDKEIKTEDVDDSPQQEMKDQADSTVSNKSRKGRQRKGKQPDEPTEKNVETPQRRKSQNEKSTPIIVKEEEVDTEKVLETPKQSQDEQSVQQELSQRTEGSEVEDPTPSRRSGRIRKPKQFEDSVTPTYRRKSRGESTSEPKTDEKKKESQQKASPAAKSASPKKQKIKEEPLYASSPKKSSRKRERSESVQDPVPVPIKKKKTPVESKEQEVSDVKKSPKKSRSKKSTEDKLPENQIKGENLDVEDIHDAEFPPVGDLAIVDDLDIGGEVSIKEESDQEGQDLPPEKQYFASTESGIETNSLKLTFKTNTGDEEQHKAKKKKRNKQQQDSKRKSSDKLFVSFKKKTKRKQNDSGNVDDTPEPSTNETDIRKDVPEVEIPMSEPEHKKKKKKKTKKEHNRKEMVDIQTFEVTDTTIVRVRKKKVFKRRNGEKILVRITKNHCNKNDEVVRSETVVFNDNLVREDDKPKLRHQDVNLNESDQNGVDDDFAIPPENVDSDEEFFPSKAAEKRATAAAAAITKKKPVIAPKKPISKPVTKTVKRTSRPANKNVTVGGKVVGKTTKGMKKTGAAVMKKTGTAGLSRAKHTDHKNIDYSDKNSHTEPKNAYNLFCRKYRPIIMASHPKADFSEISKRLACLWNMASDNEKQEHRNRFQEMQAGMKSKLTKLSRLSPSAWADKEFEFIKTAIQRDLDFTIPTYNVKNLEPVDIAAHFKLLGESLSVIAGALEQQSGMTCHGAISVMLDSILCSMGPLVCLTSNLPGVNAISDEQQARILDNISYVMPGL